jgi:hypothetical protein
MRWLAAETPIPRWGQISYFLLVAATIADWLA